MRITGGEVKGRNLAALKGLDIRPSSDLVREAIFNLIGQQVRGRVLDLFAGTGALGIEALSRGANEAVFVDLSDQALRLIKKNLKLCGYVERGKVYKRDLSRGLPSRFPWVGKKFDLVFLDPPYGKGLIPPVLKGLVERSILTSPAVLVAESRKEEVLPLSCGDLEVVDIRTYGETKIQVYEYEV
ncbi:MAG: 16S rRNA (guanine(966)-N(2))-methyltransferase RsmD [Deltaproteobacteria bacterium]|nr:16S rRNA (guanine(966)-N(2))-methyltransferase RsmD [Deltaproteobacteria bacterium]